MKGKNFFFEDMRVTTFIAISCIEKKRIDEDSGEIDTLCTDEKRVLLDTYLLAWMSRNSQESKTMNGGYFLLLTLGRMFKTDNTAPLPSELVHTKKEHDQKPT